MIMERRYLSLPPKLYDKWMAALRDYMIEEEIFATCLFKSSDIEEENFMFGGIFFVRREND
jgi:hypothetical protein